MNIKSITYLSRSQIQTLDQDLMNENWAFKLEQLMELAGLSCAAAINRVYPVHKYPRIFLAIGPGNNGGDGLVAARHLQHFGYRPTLHYPKRIPRFDHLLKQCLNNNIPMLELIPQAGDIHRQFDLIGDAIFGFSFNGELRPPFDCMIAQLKASKVPIVSFDIPSGWDVDLGNVTGLGVDPDMIISLSAPKQCTQDFKGQHWLGGRFVPQVLLDKYQLVLPAYSNADQIVCISSPEQ